MITFQNRGLIDMRAVTTFGVSSKETENPFGFFGTGLKYAIAVCLRHNCRVTIYRGLERYIFTTKKEQIRVNEFDIIYMNDQPLGFTLDLGKTWKMWQAFRELYCNTMDEYDGIVEPLCIEPEEGLTTIQITGDAMEEAYNERHEIILEGKPDWESKGVHIYKAPSRYIYYRGIRVGEQERCSTLTYNIVNHKIDLTEDRTIRYSWQPLAYIARAIVGAENDDLIEAFLFADRDSSEPRISLNVSDAEPSSEFISYVARTPFGRISNTSAIDIYKKHTKKPFDPQPVALTTIEKEQLAKAEAFLMSLGFDLTDIEPIVTDQLPEGVIGRVYLQKIYISRRAFMMGTKYVATTYLEEYLHLTKGLVDESRDMQNFLFDLIGTLGERVTGEPL